MPRPFSPVLSRSAALVVAGLLGLAACGHGKGNASLVATEVTTTTVATTTTTVAPTTVATTTTVPPTTAPPTTVVTGPTKADWIARANALCTQFNVDVDAVNAPLAKSPNSTSVLTKVIIDGIIPLNTQLIAQLRALGYPPGDQATLEDIFVTLEGHLARLAADPVGYYRADNGKMDDLLSAKFDAYGAGICGSAGR